MFTLWIAAGAAALLLALAAAFTLGKSMGSPKIVYRDIFADRPVQPHPDRELVEQNRILQERVAQLEGVISIDPQEGVYLDLIMEVDRLRDLAARKEKLRARYLRLLRAERVVTRRMAQTWTPPGFVNPFGGRVVLQVA